MLLQLASGNDPMAARDAKRSDWDLLEIPAKSIEDKNRCLVIGKIGKKHWLAVITYRDDSLRIISVRRSRKKEVEYYESSGI